jgi:hypothetical protein
MENQRKKTNAMIKEGLKLIKELDAYFKSMEVKKCFRCGKLINNKYDFCYKCIHTECDLCKKTFKIFNHRLVCWPCQRQTGMLNQSFLF